MTPLAQLWHVFVKDVRQQRWLVLLYVVLVVAAAGHALAWRPFADGVFGGTMMVVGLVILLLLASVVQGDSPTRSDAFWASHPLDPYAVLGAKVLFAIALLAVGAIGQEVVLQAYDATSADVARLVVEPVLVLGAVMLIAGLIASLTRDLRTFTMVAIVTPLAMILSIVLITALLRESVAFRIGSQAMQVTRIVALVLAAALIPWLYRTRDNRWTMRIAGYVIAGVAIVTLFTGGPVRTTAPTSEAPASRPVQHFPLSIVVPPDGVRGDPAQIAFAIVMPPVPEQLHLAIRAPIATLRFSDRSSARVPLGYSFGYMTLGSGNRPPHPDIPGVRWLPGGGTASVATTTVSGMLTPEQRLALDAGGATVVVEATIEVDTVVAGDAVRLAAGSMAQRDGHRVTVERWSHYAANPDIIVAAASLADDEPYDFDPQREYALLNRHRGEALSLNRAELNQSMDGLVLPGATIWKTRARLTALKRVPLEGAPPGDDWYRDAELLPVVRRTLGSYRDKFSLTIPPR